MGLFETIREVTRDSQMKELHRAIGEFAVAFESVTHQEWRCISWLLYSAGLKDQQIVQILLAGYTAGRMRAMLQSLIGHIRPENNAEEAIVKDLLDRHQRLISRRNDVLHGTWFIGYGNEETTDWSTAIGFKLGKDGKGAKNKTFQYKVEDFEEMIGEAESLTVALDRLTGCFTGGHAVEKNLKVDDAGRVSVRSQRKGNEQ